jgi:rhodanese-related sulfurtransferase
VNDQRAAAQTFQFALPNLCFQSFITPVGNSRLPTPVRKRTVAVVEWRRSAKPNRIVYPSDVRSWHKADIVIGGRNVMTTSVKQMMEVANAAVPRITPAQAREMMSKGNTLVVDVRDAPEVEKSGKVAGAVHVSRGMLEFRADPETPYHDKNFAKDKIVILYCASGGRSALSGKVLKDMGYREVYNLGAFKDWAEDGGAVDH